MNLDPFFEEDLFGKVFLVKKFLNLLILKKKRIIYCNWNKIKKKNYKKK